MDPDRPAARRAPWAWLPVALAGVLVGVVVAGGLTWSNPLSDLLSPGEGPWQRSGPVVVESVRNLSELTTVEVVESVTVEKGNDRGWLNFAQGDRIFLFAVATISAGVDLGELDPDDVVVDEDTNAVTITLPAPEITAIEVDNEQTRVYDRDTGLFTSGDPDLERAARLVAEELMVTAAEEEGLYDTAEAATELALVELLEGLGFADVTVRFEERPGSE